jgi:hypothetical protein
LLRQDQIAAFVGKAVVVLGEDAPHGKAAVLGGAIKLPVEVVDASSGTVRYLIALQR